jgi:hypothetical protein
MELIWRFKNVPHYDLEHRGFLFILPRWLRWSFGWYYELVSLRKLISERLAVLLLESLDSNKLSLKLCIGLLMCKR